MEKNMRKSASEILRSLEARVAKLERQASFTVGQEVPYKLPTLKKVMLDGYGFKVISVGGGLSDTLEYSLTSDQVAKISSKGKIDVMLKNIKQELSFSIEPKLKRKGRKNFIVITEKPLSLLEKQSGETMRKPENDLKEFLNFCKKFNLRKLGDRVWDGEENFTEHEDLFLAMMNPYAREGLNHITRKGVFILNLRGEELVKNKRASKSASTKKKAESWNNESVWVYDHSGTQQWNWIATMDPSSVKASLRRLGVSLEDETILNPMKGMSDYDIHILELDAVDLEVADQDAVNSLLESIKFSLFEEDATDKRTQQKIWKMLITDRGL